MAVEKVVLPTQHDAHDRILKFADLVVAARHNPPLVEGASYMFDLFKNPFRYQFQSVVVSEWGNMPLYNFVDENLNRIVITPYSEWPTQIN